jgi:hypothetical protein
MQAGARVRKTVNGNGKIDAVERGLSVSLYIAWEFGSSQLRVFEVLFDSHIHRTSHGTRYYFNTIVVYAYFTCG